MFSTFQKIRLIEYCLLSGGKNQGAGGKGHEEVAAGGPE